MDKKFIDVLKLVTKKMATADVRWMVFGSCGLALNGMQIQPDDIDILTDEEGILKINQALIDYKIQLPKIASSVIIDSTMGKFLLNGCSIEVMCNFKVKSQADGQWYEMSHLLEHPNIIDLDNFQIPVLPLTKSIELYRLMGRDKDIVKIQKIEAYIRNYDEN